jgi:hypothetical protein
MQRHPTVWCWHVLLISNMRLTITCTIACFVGTPQPSSQIGGVNMDRIY